MRIALLAGLFVAALWVLVLWIQPRMAFFPSRGVQRTPASLGLPFADLQIVTRDGVTLHGWWMEHPEPRGQIVYWHGNGGNLALWLDVLADIRRHGFSVLAVDYRGYGASGGRPSEQGIYRDAEAVTGHFVANLRRAGVPTIYWGRSLGSVVAAFAAAGRSAPDGLILESTFPAARSLFVDNPVMLGLSFLATYRFQTVRHLAGYRGPLLVIHGRGDTVIPFSAGQEVFASAASPEKSFVALEGVDHNDLYARHPAYWPAVDRFVEAIR
jgi:uncharacterized protein